MPDGRDAAAQPGAGPPGGADAEESKPDFGALGGIQAAGQAWAGGAAARKSYPSARPRACEGLWGVLALGLARYAAHLMVRYEAYRTSAGCFGQ